MDLSLERYFRVKIYGGAASVTAKMPRMMRRSKIVDEEILCQVGDDKNGFLKDVGNLLYERSKEFPLTLMVVLDPGSAHT